MFDFKKCRDLEIRVRSHSRSLKVVPFDRLCMVSCFWDIRLQKSCYLENQIRGPWRSLKMSPFDREPITSYWRSIVTMALSRVVSEIFNVEKYRDLEIPVKESIKVIEGGTRWCVSWIILKLSTWYHMVYHAGHEISNTSCSTCIV